MARSPYYEYIQRYFPQQEWDRADCVSVSECSPSRAGYPGDCIGQEVDGYSWGVFQVYDAVWEPRRNPNSPFSADIWDRRMDPNINTWVASVIWSHGGWSQWTTCAGCGGCGPGGVIPYPNGPIEDGTDGIVSSSGAAIAIILLIGLMILK
mgnify:CR=1 FL=1